VPASKENFLNSSIFVQNMPKKHERNKGAIWLTILISFIMVASIFGFVVSQENQSTNKYNGFKFSTKIDQTTGIQYYSTKINGKEIQFYNYPTAVENINLTQQQNDLLKNAQVIITVFNPFINTTDLQIIELVLYDWEQNLDKQIVRGVTLSNSSYRWSVLSCANATILTPVISFNIQEEPQYTLKDSCLTLSGDRYEMLRYRDALLYHYYGIITNT
jgi:hypothetical protein